MIDPIRIAARWYVFWNRPAIYFWDCVLDEIGEQSA